MSRHTTTDWDLPTEERFLGRQADGDDGAARPAGGRFPGERANGDAPGGRPREGRFPGERANGDGPGGRPREGRFPGDRANGDGPGGRPREAPFPDRHADGDGGQDGETQPAADVGAVRHNRGMARSARAPRESAPDAPAWEVPQFEEVHARPSPERVRRREAAARVRARRLLLADVGVGALLALIGILIAPGLAIVALFAIPLLIGCVYSLVSERTGWKLRLRLPRRRRRRPPPRRRARPR